MKYFFIFVLFSFSAYSHVPHVTSHQTYDRQVENHIDIDPIRVVYRGFSIEEFMVYKVPRLLFFENYFVHFHSSRNSVTWSDIYEISESEYDLVVNTDKPLEIRPYGMFGTRVVEAR